MIPKTPWRVVPLSGKYYGTAVEDADGNELFELWLNADGLEYERPSRRELALRWGPDPFEPGNNHYENARTLSVCEFIVDAVNKRAVDEAGWAL